MSPQIPQIVAPNKRVSVEPLDPHAFTAFGTVIQNPTHTPNAGFINHNVVSANQGSALKYIDVSHLTDHYHLAPSRKPAKSVMNMFVCSPRQLQKISTTEQANSDVLKGPDVFPVQILERHPFTPQTFIPAGLSPDDTTTKYLVIVAPTRSVSPGEAANRSPPYPLHAPRRRRSIADIFSRARPSLFTNTNDPPSSSSKRLGPQRPKGPGEPDLSQLRAFIANGSQSVTYGPGTWHAPMVVLGAKTVDFVVVQYANGVALEDCQEIAIKQETGAEGLNVIIDDAVFERSLIRERAKL